MLGNDMVISSVLGEEGGIMGESLWILKCCVECTISQGLTAQLTAAFDQLVQSFSSADMLCSGIAVA